MYDELSKKILVIEDDVQFRRSLFDQLGHEFTVVEAEDGEQGIERMLVHKPGLILLDLLLPKMDGFEVLKRIREYPDDTVKNIPVVILSNLASNEDFLKAQNLKIDAYFVKSHADLAVIKAKVKEIMYKQGPGFREDIIDFRT